MAKINNGNLTIQDCLTCYLCGNIFRKPRILPCGHTFCGECLGKLKDDMMKDGPAHGTSVSQAVDDSLGNHYTDASHCADIMSVSADADPNCYRPHPSKTDERNGMSRSSTFVREKHLSLSEQGPSRYSVPASMTAANGNVCSKCGNASPATLPRRRQSSQSPSPTLRPKDTHASSPRWNTSPKRTKDPACSFEQKHGREMELFVCPLPDCNYTLRLMNLARWSPKNIILSELSAVWNKLQDNKIDAGTQTDISNDQSLLVTIPRALINSRPLHLLGERRRHSSLMDMALASTTSVEGLSPGYLPRGNATWRSYAALIGMNILHQIVHF